MQTSEMQTVSDGIEKYFKMLSAVIFIESAKR